MHKQCREGVDWESIATTGQSNRTWLLQMSSVRLGLTLGPATENTGMLDKHHTCYIFSVPGWMRAEGVISVTTEVPQKAKDEWVTEI